MKINTTPVPKIVSACDVKNGELGIVISEGGANGHYVLAVTTQLMVNLTTNSIWERRSAESFKVFVLPPGTKVILEQ